MEIFLMHITKVITSTVLRRVEMLLFITYWSLSHVAETTDPPPTSSEDHGAHKHSLHRALIPKGNGTS